jgi:hypothetical protein
VAARADAERRRASDIGEQEMFVHRSIRLQVCAVVVGFAALGRIAHAELDRLPDLASPEVKELIADLTRHDQAGDCKFVDDFVDRNVRGQDAAGTAARFVALVDLTRSRTVAADDNVRCRYHDRRAAVELAVWLFEAHAVSLENPASWYPVEVPLEHALGRTWREKLAETGTRAAMQDLVVLHLSCIRKDDRVWSEFWDWLLKGSTGDVWLDVERELDLAVGFPACAEMPVPASLETACYWNAVERNLAIPTEPLVASKEMRLMLVPNIMRARGDQIARAGMDFAERNGITLQDPRADIHFYQMISDIIAEGCAATLPPAARKRVAARAAQQPSRRLESLLAEVQ